MARKSFWDKVVERIGEMDAGSAQAAVGRLASAHGRLEAVLDNLGEGVLLLDGEGRVEYANRGAESLLGAEPGGLSGHALGEWLGGEDWGEVVRGVEAAPEGGARREAELDWLRRRALSVKVTPIGGGASAGEGARAVAILRDVTGERMHTAERVEAERLNAILLLAAEVAHEIGNPLNAIQIHLQLLERAVKRLPGDERENLGELVGVARSETARLGRVLSQFLKAIRSSAPEFAPTDLPGVVAETLDALEGELEDRRIAVDAEAPPEPLPAVWADKLQAGQACYNVVRNAAQAMSPGGVLTIRYLVTDRDVGVAFRDTGPGIKPGRLGGLFEAFSTTKPDGHGLGLLVVERIMRDHGGAVEIDTARGGTEMRLKFRRVDRLPGLLGAAKDEAAGAAREED